jgi:hypothetical protein
MRWIFPIFLCFAQIANAQLTEMFDDGDFKNNPQWVGQTDKYEINASGQLHLNAPQAASEAWLFTASTSTENASWAMDVVMQFDPSSQNYARIYLISDSPDPSSTKNGFYVMLGNTDDDVSLYEITNGTAKRVIDGTNGRLTASSVTVSIKTTYSDIEGWQLWIKTGDTWQSEGVCPNKPTVTSGWFGVYCKYSSTRSDKFFFDNIVVTGTPLKDKLPPKVHSVTVTSAKLLQVSFNEAMDENSLLPQAFIIQPINLQPSTIDYDDNIYDAKLHLPLNLEDGFKGTIHISGIMDKAGNLLKDTIVALSFDIFKCTQIKPTSNKSVQLTFNNPLQAQYITADQFVLLPANAPAQDVTFANDKTVELSFELPFANKTHNQIKCDDVTSTNSDTLRHNILAFDYVVPERFDLVITEFMTDPDPAVGLPESEYIEIFNRLDFDIDLSGFAVMVAGRKYPIDNGTLKANGYLCLSAMRDSLLWNGFDNTLLMRIFPPLTNTAGNIVLLSNQNKTLDAVTYNADWQTGNFKDEGGWSFERIDANNPSNVGNWGRSVHLTGGTPGLANSIAAENSDTSRPYLHSLEVKPNNTVILHFSEEILPSSIALPTFTPNHIHSIQVSLDSLFCSTLTLSLDTIIPNEVYEITWQQKLTDLSGNELTPYYPMSFGSPQPILTGDVLINEILFNPLPGDEDYIEIINVSNKTINLAQIFMAKMVDDMPESMVKLSSMDIPLLPNCYFTFSGSAESYLNKAQSPWWLFGNAQLPNMPDDAGDFALVTANGTVIDRLQYDQSWHFPLLNSTQGVSLERISAAGPTNDKGNWQSASAQSGYGTPTSANSQAVNLQAAPTAKFSLSPDVFTPNGDGMDDMLIIGAPQELAGSVVTIRVYDPLGRLVNTIANNQFLGNNSLFKWDGTTADGRLADNGIYIVWIRSYDTKGNVLEEKKACVLGSSPQ